MSIMVAYDGTEAAKGALDLAKAHAKAFKTEIEVVQAADKGEDLVYPDVEKLEKKLEKEIKKLMNDEDIPFKTTLLVSSDTAGEQITRHLELKNSSEICMGVRRRSKVGKLLSGSTAQYVILNAPCPVVSVK